jgi:hypothetical protein
MATFRVVFVKKVVDTQFLKTQSQLEHLFDSSASIIVPKELEDIYWIHVRPENISTELKWFGTILELGSVYKIDNVQKVNGLNGNVSFNFTVNGKEFSSSIEEADSELNDFYATT